MTSTSPSSPNSASSAASSSLATPEATPIESSFTTTRFGAFALFCVQHPDLFRFIVQVCFSGIVLVFCIHQLAVGDRTKDGKNDAIYWGGVTSILAWWMPSPGGRLQNQANIAGNLNVETSQQGASPPLPSGSATATNAPSQAANLKEDEGASKTSVRVTK